jgi:hypothetical protein
MLSPPPELAELFQQLPAYGRYLSAAIGALFLVAGSRAYRLAVVLPGALLGVGAAVVVGAAAGLGPGATATVAAITGVGGAIVAYLVEKAAVVLAGVMVGVALAAVGTAAAGITAPWWAWPVAAGLGGLAARSAWKLALVPLTAWLGAAVIATSLALPPHPWLVPGLTTAGVVVQVLSGLRTPSAPAPKGRKQGKKKERRPDPDED